MAMASTTTLNASDARGSDGDKGDSRCLLSPTTTDWSVINNDYHTTFRLFNYNDQRDGVYSATSATPFHHTSSLLFDKNCVAPQEQFQQGHSSQQHQNDCQKQNTCQLKCNSNSLGKYATILLQRNSPEELRSGIDESLGPYISSRLTEFMESSAAKKVLSLEDSWIDYESVLELILEHCSMTKDVATQTLYAIYRAAQTGEIPFQFTEERDGKGHDGQRCHGILDSNSNPIVTSFSHTQIYHQYDQPQSRQQDYNSKDLGDDELEMLVGQMMFEDDEEEQEIKCNGDQMKIAAKNREESKSRLSSYLYEDAVESGIIDMPSDSNIRGQVNHANGTSGLSNSPNSVSSINGDPAIVNGDPAIININCHPPRPSKASNLTVKEQKKRNKAADDMLAKDVAAALFKPSRPRSNSNLSDTATSKRNGAATNATTSASPTLFPSIGTTPPNNFYPIENSNCGYYFNSGSYQQHDHYHYQDAIAQQIQATAELLLSMQSDLSTNAALSASMMANGDVNIAYYLIDQAMNAPLICRHMLQYTCYRADCAFSHDVDGHTCTFWLKGRCGKGDSCRFLHGFNKYLMEGICEPIHQASSTIVSTDTISGTVDQQHQLLSQEDLPAPCSATFGGAIVTQNLLRENESRKRDSISSPRNTSPFSMPPRMGFVPLDPFESSTSCLQKAEVTDNKDIRTISFAKIAAVNDDTLSASSFFKSSSSNNFVGKHQKEKVMKIPQELWTSSMSRDSTLYFQMADPFERYNAVNSNHIRPTQTADGLLHVIDLHYQSVKTAPLILSTVLPQKLVEVSELSNQERTKGAGVWIITGSGHHVNTQSHQKRNGVLENAVLKWLQEAGYDHCRGKDRNGYGGAIYVTADPLT